MTHSAPILLRHTEARTYYKGQEVQSIRLTQAQEAELFLALKASPDSPRILEKIVVSYMAFALRQARRDMGSRSREACQKVGLNEDDAISAANLGLMQAIRRFDPLKGRRFTTYAGFWIKKYLAEARYNVHLIRVSCSDRKLYSRFAKMIRAGMNADDIADITGYALEEVERVLQIAKGRQDNFDEWSRHHGDEEKDESPFSPKAQDNATQDGNTAEELAKQELLEKLEKAKLHMGKDELAYVYDHFSRGMSITEMARVRGRSTHEVKTKLATILSTLRVLLQE